MNGELHIKNDSVFIYKCPYKSAIHNHRKFYAFPKKTPDWFKVYFMSSHKMLIPSVILKRIIILNSIPIYHIKNFYVRFKKINLSTSRKNHFFIADLLNILWNEPIQSKNVTVEIFHRRTKIRKKSKTSWINKISFQTTKQDISVENKT